MERTRAEPVIGVGGDGAALPVQQSRSAPSRKPSAERPRPAGPAPSDGGPGSARGEHTHGETPAPRMPQRHSVRGQVLAALREALLSGELRSGVVYSAPALAERWDVSPTPVREAMQQLASEGAVETVPNRGFRVAEHSADDLAELAEVRILLELPVLLRLLEEMPSAHWQRLRPLAEASAAQAARGDRAGCAEADREFHRALLDPAGNRQLVAVAEDLWRRTCRPAARPDDTGAAERAPDLATRAAEHQALVEALVAGDASAVREVLTRHLSA